MTIIEIAVERIKKGPITYGALNRYLIQKEIYSAAQILNRLETKGFVTSVTRPIDHPTFFGRKTEKVYTWSGKEMPKRGGRIQTDPACPKYLVDNYEKWSGRGRKWQAFAERHEKYKEELERFGFKVVLPSEATTGAADEKPMLRAWRNRFIDERMNAYPEASYEMRRCYAETDANEFETAFHAALKDKS